MSGCRSRCPRCTAACRRRCSRGCCCRACCGGGAAVNAVMRTEEAGRLGGGHGKQGEGEDAVPVGRVRLDEACCVRVPQVDVAVAAARHAVVPRACLSISNSSERCQGGQGERQHKLFQRTAFTGPRCLHSATSTCSPAAAPLALIPSFLPERQKKNTKRHTGEHCNSSFSLPVPHSSLGLVSASAASDTVPSALSAPSSTVSGEGRGALARRASMAERRSRRVGWS